MNPGKKILEGLRKTPPKYIGGVFEKLSEKLTLHSTLISNDAWHRL